MRKVNNNNNCKSRYFIEQIKTIHYYDNMQYVSEVIVTISNV